MSDSTERRCAVKLAVQRIDGQIEVLTLVPPVTVQLGTLLNSITDGSGTDYFFDLDGRYDGWGRGVNLSPEQALERMEQVEASREIRTPSPNRDREEGA